MPTISFLQGSRKLFLVTMATQPSVFQFCSNRKPESPSNFQNFLSIFKRKLYDLLHEVKLVGGGVGLKAGVFLTLMILIWLMKSDPLIGVLFS